VLPRSPRDGGRRSRAGRAIEDETDRRFEAVHEDLDALDETLKAAYAAVEDVDGWDSPAVSAAEDLQVALGNELVPALYMSRRDYDHEPALPTSRSQNSAVPQTSMGPGAGNGSQRPR